MKRRGFLSLLGAAAAAPAVFAGCGISEAMAQASKPAGLNDNERIITAIDREAGVLTVSSGNGPSEDDFVFMQGDPVNFEVGDFLVWRDIE